MEAILDCFLLLSKQFGQDARLGAVFSPQEQRPLARRWARSFLGLVEVAWAMRRQSSQRERPGAAYCPQEQVRSDSYIFMVISLRYRI